MDFFARLEEDYSSKPIYPSAVIRLISRTWD
jgi:hypothetical protein